MTEKEISMFIIINEGEVSMTYTSEDLKAAVKSIEIAVAKAETEGKLKLWSDVKGSYAKVA